MTCVFFDKWIWIRMQYLIIYQIEQLIKLNKKSPWSKWSMSSTKSETCNQVEQSKIRCLIKMTNDMFSQIKHFIPGNKPS
jgi:hypothetical protein